MQCHASASLTRTTGRGKSIVWNELSLWMVMVLPALLSTDGSMLPEAQLMAAVAAEARRPMTAGG